MSIILNIKIKTELISLFDNFEVVVKKTADILKLWAVFKIILKEIYNFKCFPNTFKSY